MDHLSASDKVERHQGRNALPVQRRLEAEVEALQRLDRYAPDGLWGGVDVPCSRVAYFSLSDGVSACSWRPSFESFILRQIRAVQDVFRTFVDELRDDLNPSVSEAEAFEMLILHLITKPVFDALCKKPLRDRVIFGGSFDLAILSGTPTLDRAKRFWWSSYAIAGVCRLRVILFAVPRRFCPIAASASRAFCSGQPELSGGASSWHRHCAIPQTAVGAQPAPAFSPNPQGSMTGDSSHNPVTVAIRAGHPGWPIPIRAFAPLTVV